MSISMINEQVKLPLSRIRTDGGTQLRVAMNEEHINDLVRALFCGSVIDAIAVFFDGSEYWLADGFHRYRAMEQLGHDSISVEIKQGTRRDAVLHAAGANATHGLKRTNADKRNVVEALLNDPEWAMWSDREVARRCGVSSDFVSRIRPICHSMTDTLRLVERNGTTYTMTTAHIGHSQPVVSPGRNVDNIPFAVPHISSKNNEWYTPAKYIAAARELMGGIDLDPASCDLANETVKADQFYTILTNGLDQDWAGKRIWLNPPYGYTDGESNQSLWSDYLIQQYEKAKETTEAVLLVNAAVDTRWFQRLFDYPVCLTLGRINFVAPESSTTGSTHGSAFVYFGEQKNDFFKIFSEFGKVVRPW